MVVMKFGTDDICIRQELPVYTRVSNTVRVTKKRGTNKTELAEYKVAAASQ